MNILTYCEADMYFKEFLKRTILLPKDKICWNQVYTHCSKDEAIKMQNAVDLLNEYRFLAACTIDFVRPYKRFCQTYDVTIQVWIPLNRVKWWQDCGQAIYQRLFYPIVRHQFKKSSCAMPKIVI